MKTYLYLVLIAVLLTISTLALKAQNHVVGYLPTYNNFPNSIYNTDLDVLTQVNIAFVDPDASGNISAPNGTSTVVSVAHAKGVKVLLSICGGAGNGNTYRTVLSNTTLTNTFINNLVQMTLNNGLDGIDVDIEGNILDGNYVTPAQYENFVTKLATALHAQNKLMTAALAGWFVNNVTNTAAQAFDLIGLMSYDAYGGWTGPGQHSPYQMAVDDFNYWKNNKGVAANKLLVGLPFYGYGWGTNQRAWPYADVVNTYPGAENLDQIGSGANVIYYNGIPTIKQKVTFAKNNNAAGVMIWELTQDLTGSPAPTKSLLKAIGEVMGPKNTNFVPDNLAKNKPVTVSSTEVGQNVASNLTDGLYNTRWSSLYADPQWAYVDLQDIYTVQEIKILWETAMAKNYVVETSLDAQTWINQKTVTNNNTAANTHTGMNVKARYVRIYGTSRTSTYGYSIFEIEVYGKALPKPYTGTAVAVPGIIQAENYDLGGEGVAYHESGASNVHGQYRTTEGVDIENCTDAGTGYNVGDIQTGEWMMYTVNVTQSGQYDFTFRVAATASGKTFHVEVDDVNVTGAVQVPNTGGWQTWQNVVVKNISLTQGKKMFKVVMDSDLFNLNYMQLDLPVITGVDLDNKIQCEISPNPVGDKQIRYVLTNSNDRISKIIIRNINGSVVSEIDSTANAGTLHLEHLTAGVYLIELLTDNQSVIKKIVIL